MSRNALRILLPLLLLFLATAVYWPGLSGGFIFDDYANIVENEAVHADTVDLASMRRAATAYSIGDYGRPLATMSFAFDHAIGGLEPRTYKISSLIVHLVNALLVFALILWLIRHVAFNDKPARDPALWCAFAIATIWAIHPLQVSAVLYVVQRMETLSLTFVLAALLAYLSGRQRQIDGRTAWPWLLACVPLVALALMSKETGILFPAYTLALELTILRFSARSLYVTRSWRMLYSTGACVAVLVFTLYVWPRFANTDAYFIRDYDAGERVLTQGRVLMMYLGQILLPLPHTLHFYYDNFPASHGWLSPVSTLLSALAVLALLGFAWIVRSRAPLASLGILWFFAAHLLTSNIIPLELAFEHRNYFALLGVLLVFAEGMRSIIFRNGPALKYVGVATVTIGLGGMCVLRAAVWGDPLLLSSELTRINPGSSRASNDLARVYLDMTDGYADSPFQDFAIREFARGAAIPGSSIVSDVGLLVVSTGANRPVDAAWWSRLEDKLTRGTIRPETTGAMFDLLKNRQNGILLDDRRITKSFLIFFQRASLPPSSYAEFGEYLLNYAHNEPLADHIFVTAIDKSRGYPGYARKIISTLGEKGYVRQAALAKQEAQKIGVL